MAVCTSTYNDMSQMKKDWIAYLTEKVLLTPIDLTAPVGYFSLVFGFGGGPWEEVARRRTMAHLFVRLSKVIETFPFLGGQLLLDDGQLERSRLFFSRDPRARNINRMVKSDEHPTHSIMNEMLDMKNKCGGPFAGPVPRFELAAHQVTRLRQINTPSTTPINPATLPAYRWTPNPPDLPPVGITG